MNTTTPRIQQKTVLATFASESKPGHSHEVRLGADGVVYCTCPSWRFQKLTPSGIRRNRNGIRSCSN